MNLDFKSRLRNKVFWTSLAAFIVLVAQQFHLFDVPENWEQLVNSLVSLFVMLGIVIDPTTPGISDDDSDGE